MESGLVGRGIPGARQHPKRQRQPRPWHGGNQHTTSRDIRYNTQLGGAAYGVVVARTAHGCINIYFWRVEDNYNEACRAEPRRAEPCHTRSEQSPSIWNNVCFTISFGGGRSRSIHLLNVIFICEICRVPSYRLCIGMRTYCQVVSRSRMVERG